MNVADAEDEEQRSIGCPPNSVDVATRFQISRPDRIQPERVTGWIEITITRDNYYLIANGANSADQVEYVIREPLMPVIHPVTSVPTRGLYIGQYAFGLEVSNVCF